LLQPPQKRRYAGLPFRIVLGPIHEHPLALLRTRLKRTRSSGPAEQRDERISFPCHNSTI